jgi:hypothetical protein
MKTCFKCGQTKSLDEYYVHPRMADGRLNKCKECTKADVIEHCVSNIERVRAYDRKRGYLAHRLEKRKQYSKTDAGRLIARRSREKYNLNYPNRIRANSAVNTAIRSGRLRKQPCEICGARKVEAHHADYSRPLDVRWLCRLHHSQVHVALREMKRKASGAPSNAQ